MKNRKAIKKKNLKNKRNHKARERKQINLFSSIKIRRLAGVGGRFCPDWFAHNVCELNHYADWSGSDGSCYDNRTAPRCVRTRARVGRSGARCVVGGVFGLRTRVDEIWPSMDFGIWISMLFVWLDGWGEPIFCLVGWMRLHGMRILD